MSKSFALINGDLSLSGRAYLTVEGSAKLAQDLRLWVLEKIGIDPATPTYGSSLDGGVINGVNIPSLIGQINSQAQTNQVQAVVQSLLVQYQQMQLDKIKVEIVKYGSKSTIPDDEILETINSVKAIDLQDMILVQVSLTTMAGTNLTLTIPLSI